MTSSYMNDKIEAFYPITFVDADGSLTIYIQHEKPEGEKAANWLPAPAEPFYIAMRIYGPEEIVLNDEWIPPPVVKRVD